MRNAVDTAPSLRNLERSLLEPDDVLELVEKALLDLLWFAADAAQDTDPYFLFAGAVAAAAAGPARFLDDLALAVATRAGGDIDDLSEDRLRRPPHLAGAAALRAGLRRRARFRARSLAGRAGFGPRDGELALDAEDRFFERQPQVESKVGAPPRTGPR